MSDFSHHTSECRCAQCVRDLDAQLEIRRLRAMLDKVVMAKHRAFEENRDLRARLKAVRSILAMKEDHDPNPDSDCNDCVVLSRATDLRVKDWKADR